MSRRICLSSTAEEFEAWLPQPEHIAPGSDEEVEWYRSMMEPWIFATARLVPWDRQHPLHLERWPDVLEDYRRAGLVA